MPFDYDLTRHTGRPSQLLPDLIQALREGGLDVHPSEKQVLLRHAASRVQATLSFVPKDAALLQLQVPVSSIPAPPADAVFTALAAWNAETEGLTAHTVLQDDQARVVIKATLVPNQDAKPAFSAGDIERLLERMVEARSGLQRAIAV